MPRSRLLSRIIEGAVERVLDVGCGPGTNARHHLPSKQVNAVLDSAAKALSPDGQVHVLEPYTLAVGPVGPWKMVYFQGMRRPSGEGAAPDGG